jgi:hypothetical protein
MVAEVDLNHCRQVKDKWGFQMTQRLREYGDAITAAARHDFQPQVVRDPGLGQASATSGMGALHHERPKALSAPTPSPAIALTVDAEKVKEER